MKKLLLCAVLILLAACAPRLQEISVNKEEPRLTEQTFHTADGVDLPLRRFLPDGAPKAVMLALHGFNDYSKGFTEPGKKFAQAGIAFYAYDQRGFGEAPQRGIWAGEQQMVNDLIVAARLLKDQYPTLPLFLLGESMGGAVLALAATSDHPPPADGLIFSAPALWSWNNLSPFSRWVLEHAAHTIPWVTVRPTGLKIRASSNNRALYDLARDPLVIKDTRIDTVYFLVNIMSDAQWAIQNLSLPRHLILYGQHEQVLSGPAVQSALRLLPDLPSAQQRIVFYSEGYHLLLRDLTADQVINDILFWMAHPQESLPSGMEGFLPNDHGSNKATAPLPPN